MTANRLKNIGVLVGIFGTILFLGVGVGGRPLVRARPLLNADGSPKRDPTGAVLYDPEAVARIQAARRPSDMAVVAGTGLIALGGALFLLGSRRSVPKPAREASRPLAPHKPRPNPDT